MVLRASILVVSLLVACGGTALPNVEDGGTDASADHTSGDSGGDGGACVLTPKEGDPCVPGQVSCDKVFGCCSPMYGCNATTKKWEILAVGCACQSFACGDKQCLGSEVCRKQSGGVPLPDGGVAVTYSCESYPTTCQRDQTCDCLAKSPPLGCILIGGSSCAASSAGITVTCAGQ